MLEKDIIRESVTHEWEKFLIFEKNYGSEAEETKIQRAKWYVLDNLWYTLYGCECKNFNMEKLRANAGVNYENI